MAPCRSSLRNVTAFPTGYIYVTEVVNLVERFACDAASCRALAEEKGSIILECMAFVKHTHIKERILEWSGTMDKEMDPVDLSLGGFRIETVLMLKPRVQYIHVDTEMYE